jgi:hypothetical protein
MLERYGYPEQSLTQVLISMESCVACLSIQRKSGENIQILYVMFLYYCGLILWRFWKVSVINTEIVDIYIKLRKLFCAETRNFDVKAEQQSLIKFCVELGITPILTRGLLKLNECARTGSRTSVYPSHK